MGDWSRNLATLSEDALSRLCEMLDNPTCGWRQLAEAVKTHAQVCCSESELTSCSMQVLSPTGSPARYLMARLAERSCSLCVLLGCLKKMDHRHAVRYLTATVMEQIRITVQPQSQQAFEGGRVVLTCRAAGPTGLSYQWFRGKEQISGGTGSAADLILCPLGPDNQGHYICCSRSLCPGSKSGLCISRQPRSQTATEGDTLILECLAEANPPARYHWYHNMKAMQQQKSSVLRHQCSNESVSAVFLTVSCPRFANASVYATDKVALLIGNMNYAHHTQLFAPMADVHELANLLRQLDFKVVSLLDLNWQEMNSAVTEFLLLLDKGVYEAYEVKRDDLNNGFFISFLKQRLCEDEKVTVMLDKVAEGMYHMGRCKLMQGRQALELRSNLSERRALTDRIQNTGSSTGQSARNLQWAIAHELIDFPEEGVDLDQKKSNQESIFDAGSLLPILESLPSPQIPSLYTRLRSLQRLKTELTFTVCLHYRYSNMDDEEVQETQSITVGKPLVSKLNLHQPRLRRSASDDLHSFNTPETSLYVEDLGQDGFAASETSSIGSASTTWSYYSQSAREQPSAGSPTTKRVNAPENNTIEAECLPKPLSASKSLTQSQTTQDTCKHSDTYNFHSY
ncbi:hypothetical protein NHX12_033091 [Muraenolepis orangiensis]|uniref:Ig-like domain-containing protein n=1 Tax=Muraenolepis orangiensis TaxID=630683 RepID=A0A9Q0IIE2_9TELE|nr:hypothetical protein NHX12_033091 [Muraenolepis orangiensis]